MKEKMRLITEISLIIRELSYSRRGYRPESYAAALDNLTIIGDLADIEFDRVLIEDDRWTGAYDGGNAQ